MAYRITIDINIDPEDKEEYLDLLDRIAIELAETVEDYSWECTDDELDVNSFVEEIG